MKEENPKFAEFLGGRIHSQIQDFLCLEEFSAKTDEFLLPSVL